VEHRSERAQEHVAVVRAREVAVATRTKLINHVRGAVKSMGRPLPKCSAEAFVKRAPGAVPLELKPALEPLLALITLSNEQIVKYDRVVERLIEDEYRDAKVLTQITGVGPLTAVTFAVTIGDRKRFARSRTVGAWVGLTPGQRASGKQDPQQTNHERRRRVPSKSSGQLRALRAGAVRPRLRSAPPRPGDRRTRRSQRKETSGRGRGPKTRGADASAVVHASGLRTVAECQAGGRIGVKGLKKKNPQQRENQKQNAAKRKEA
jgi:transposase